MKIFGREPVLILAFFDALINFGIGFGLDWTTEQVVLVNAVLAALLSVIARSRVSPVSYGD